MADDRVFLITGASSGIGAATARQAAAAGFRLVLAARSGDRLAALARELGGPDRVLAEATDVADYDAQAALVARTLDTFGRLDIAFANAGIGAPGLGDGSPETPAKWREMILTNVLGAAYTIRASYDAIVSARGHMLLTGSLVGRKAIRGSLYSSTKWAITGMSEALRLDVTSKGVRVTLVEPGLTDTEFFTQPPEVSVQPQDIARAVLFAVSQPAHVDVSHVLVRPVGQEL